MKNLLEQIKLRNSSNDQMKFKKGKTICFIGTDGAGKSTLLKEVVKVYQAQPKTKVSSLYFGWSPFLPSTKLASKILKRNNYRIAESMNKKEVKFSFVQEVMLCYYYLEYLSRYLLQIWPKLFQNDLVIVDRYFYDMYVHYNYAKKSRLFKLLMKTYPRPDNLFFLNVNINTAKERKPEMDLELLKTHRESYLKLSEMMKMKQINTEGNVDDCVRLIVDSCVRC